jgi:transcriptional regulator with XRE-family HTH domain
MQLKQWIHDNGKTQQEVADQLAMDKARLSRIINGEQNPTLFQVATIYELTEGAVTYHDWLERVKP